MGTGRGEDNFSKGNKKTGYCYRLCKVRALENRDNRYFDWSAKRVRR